MPYVGHSERCVGGSLMSQPRKRMDMTTADGRTEKDSQLAFINNANFILVVNRKIDGNDVVKKICQASDEQLSGTAIKTYLRSIKSQTSNASIKAYISNVYNLPAPVISAFFKKYERVSAGK